MNSVKKNKPTFVNISNETVMVGLSCGEVSSEAWQVLSSTLSHCVSISDKAVAPLIALFANGSLGGGKIEAGECATSGVASLLAILKDKKLKAQVGLTDNSVILLIGTEGATDLKAYGDLLEKGKSFV